MKIKLVENPLNPEDGQVCELNNEYYVFSHNFWRKLIPEDLVKIGFLVQNGRKKEIAVVFPNEPMVDAEFTFIATERHFTVTIDWYNRVFETPTEICRYYSKSDYDKLRGYEFDEVIFNKIIQ